MGEIKIDGHPIPEVEGDGNCGECVFNGRAADLGIASRDRVSVEWSEDNRVTWRRRYTGIAVQVGSSLNPGTSGYKLVGLMKKLEEAETRLQLLPKGDLGDQVQALITNTVASGQWGNLIQGTVVRQGVPAVTSGALVPNYQPVSVVLKEKLCSRLTGSRVAINADCQVLFGVPSGTLLIDEATPGVQMEWNDIGSEELATDVRLQWTAGMNASYYLSQASDPPGPTPKLDPGSPAVFTVLQHTTQLLIGGGSVGSPVPDNWPFGHATRTEAIPLDRSDFVALNGSSYAFQSTGSPSTVTVTGDLATLRDDNFNTAVTLSGALGSGSGSRGFLVSFQLDIANLPHGFSVLADRATFVNIAMILNRPGGGYASLYCDVLQHDKSGVFLIPDAVAAAATGVAFSSISVSIFIATTQDLLLRSCCAVNMSGPSLAIPRALDRRPAPLVGTAIVPGWIDPQPTVRIQRRGPNGEDLGLVTLPGTLFRYEPGLTPPDGSAIGLQTTIQLGQPDTAENLGEAALIKARDRRATLNAITVAS